MMRRAWQGTIAVVIHRLSYQQDYQTVTCPFWEAVSTEKELSPMHHAHSCYRNPIDNSQTTNRFLWSEAESSEDWFTTKCQLWEISASPYQKPCSPVPNRSTCSQSWDANQTSRTVKLSKFKQKKFLRKSLHIV